ncbi:MAG: Protein-disulfide isomerase-like protein [Solirubrobacterales bacterium]|jgi:protein-disulfide isomerase|nr:Protein-disulfide isomerase-like protein [Solirubrobacterales bacterium]
MSTGARIERPTRIPVGVTRSGDGIFSGTGPITVEAYIDFLCPFCRQFEQRTGPALDRLVADGLITLVNHPVGFLDRVSTTAYSSRASAASGCASDGGRFDQYAKALFANQPPEGGPGLSDAELIGLGQAVGLDASFGRCVAAHVYLPWTAYVTARAIERGVSGTPSVFVQGVPVPAEGRPILAAVQAAATPG